MDTNGTVDNPAESFLAYIRQFFAPDPKTGMKF